MHTQNKHYTYLDLLRLIACICIVMVHVSALNWNTTPINTFSFAIMTAYNNFGFIGVPIFVMISGALLLDSNKIIPIKNLYLNKIVRLIIAYFIWLLFYNIVNFIELGTTPNFSSLKKDIILRTLLGNGIYHLWFIPMLISLYIIVPIFREAFAKKHICEYFIVLYIFITIAMPTLLLFDFSYKTIVSSLYERIPFNTITSYTGYFVIGHYLHQYRPFKTTKKPVLLGVVGVLSYLCGVIVRVWDSSNSGVASTLFSSPLTLPLFISTISVFVYVQYRVDKYASASIGEKGLRLLTYLSSLTFGIYFIHPFIIRIIDNVSIDTLYFLKIKIHPIYSIPILVVFVLLLSAVPIIIIKKIRFVNKYLV